MLGAVLPLAVCGIQRADEKGIQSMYWHSCGVVVLKVLAVSLAVTYNWLLFFRAPPGNSSSSQAAGGALGLGRLLRAWEVCGNRQNSLRRVTWPLPAWL